MGPVRADTALTIRFLCFALRDILVQRCAGGQPSWPPPAASLSVGGTTPVIFIAAPRSWHRVAQCPVQVIDRRQLELCPVRVSVGEKKVTDFPEISRKFEGLRLELVSINFALVQQKSVPGPSRNSASPEARSNASVLFTGTIQDIGKLQGRKYERQDQPEH